VPITENFVIGEIELTNEDWDGSEKPAAGKIFRDDKTVSVTVGRGNEPQEIKFTFSVAESSNDDISVRIDAYPIIHYGSASDSPKTVTKKITINSIIPKGETTSEHIETIKIFDSNSSDVKKLQVQYLEYDSKRLDFTDKY
jgi:hypothetical protein